MWHHSLTLRSWAELIGLLIIGGLLVYAWRKRPKTVPEKLRVLSHFRGVFPEWTLQRKARVIERAFDAEVAEAKAKKDFYSLQVISHRCRDETEEYTDAIEELCSRRLMKKAIKLMVNLEGLEWETGRYEHHYLTHASQAKLWRAIVEESRKTWEFRLKIIGALTGLVGALIGLVAFLTRKP